MIEIREILPSEGREAAEVSAAAFAAHRNVYRPKANSTTSSNHDLSCLVALSNGRVVGTVSYGQKGARLHILGLAVHPKEQRRGVGKTLVAELVRRARHLGCPVVSAYTILEAGQLPALSLLGFVVRSKGRPAELEPVGSGPLTEAYLELPSA